MLNYAPLNFFSNFKNLAVQGLPKLQISLYLIDLSEFLLISQTLFYVHVEF